MPQNPTSLPFLVSYADTLSSAKSRPLIQTALTAIASLQEIDCVCIDNITLPDDIAEAGARLGAYTTADLVWFHFSKHSLMTQKVFEKAVRGLFAHCQLGSPSLDAFRVVTLGFPLSFNTFTFLYNFKKHYKLLTYRLLHLQF